MPTHPLLAMARTLGNPVFEGDIATLIWQGVTAPRLIDDFHNWDDSPQKMLPVGAELWYFSIPLPTDAYLEYAFIDPRTGDRIPDPLNPNRVDNGANGYNHYFYMPQGKPNPLVRPIEGVARGKVTRHAVPTREYATGAKRIVYLYRPPVEAPVPLLFVYDGSAYLHRARLNIIVDNLIAEKRIRPFAMAMVQNLFHGLLRIDPANASDYENNTRAYLQRLDGLDRNISDALSPLENRKLLALHPAWGYFAEEYELTQVAIEENGKEPTALGLAEILDFAKQHNVSVVFAEPQFSTRMAENIAEEIGGVVVMVDDLAKDYIDNLQIVAEKIAEGLSGNG